MIGKKPDVTVTATEHSVAAGGNITDSTITVNARDPLDRQLIEILLADKAQLLSENAQLREQVIDAVTGLYSLDSESSAIDLAREALAKGDSEQVKTLYQTDARRKAMEGKERLREAAGSYRRLGALAFLDDTTAALEAYENAVDAWPDDISSWNQLGHLYKRTGELDLAIEAYSKVAELADSTDEAQAWTAESLHNLGIVYCTHDQLYSAEEMQNQSLSINTELDRKEGIAGNYHSLGVVQFSRGKMKQAAELYERALAINTELGHKEGMAMNYNNLGNVQSDRGDFELAAELYESSLAINTELGHKEGMAFNYASLGGVQYKLGDFGLAAELWEKALKINTELGYKEGMAYNYASLGNVHHARDELDQARESWERSAEILDAIKVPPVHTLRSSMRSQINEINIRLKPGLYWTIGLIFILYMLSLGPFGVLMLVMIALYRLIPRS